MYTVYVTDFTSWREQARQLLLRNIQPATVQWLETDTQQPTLFNEEKVINKSHALIAQKQFTIPRAFIELAEKVACHRSEQKWPLLYIALWRITHGEKHLLQLSSDDVVHTLLRMQKNVTRDAHKMKAFVRFKLYKKADEEFYIAWHRPDHKILKLVAPFFQRRFSVMRWVIVTPDGAIGWDGQHLYFDESIKALTEPITDAMEDLWRTYYRAIFNPARIKLKAMRREMPVRHWPTLPETQIITEMLQEAPQRVAKMLQYAEGFAQSAADFIPAEPSIINLRQAAANCQGCALYHNAKQIVFSVGPTQAKIMLVGEQPGDYEDETGMPFVGPAGKLLDELLVKADIQREKIYLTNAVKHFKFKLQNNKRLHVTPNVREITACKPWLIAEIAALQPQFIVCLGLTAAKSLINYGFHMKEHRGQWFAYAEQQQIMVTYHPSAILRAVNESQQQEIYQHLLNDLKKVAAVMR